MKTPKEFLSRWIDEHKTPFTLKSPREVIRHIEIHRENADQSYKESEGYKKYMLMHRHRRLNLAEELLDEKRAMLPGLELTRQQVKRKFPEAYAALKNHDEAPMPDEFFIDDNRHLSFIKEDSLYLYEFFWDGEKWIEVDDENEFD